MKEIERKFLVKGKPWEDPNTGLRWWQHIRQGYLARGETTVRVRTRSGGQSYVHDISDPNNIKKYWVDNTRNEGFLTIKGPRVGNVCDEYEYAIPYDEAVDLLVMCKDLVLSKTRYVIKDPEHNQKWEVDVFDGINAGLVVAEIELDSPDAEIFLPEWIGQEVSNDGRYSNSYLVTFKV